MDKTKALYYIEHSFLSSLLSDEDVTDITYNGEEIFYVSNKYGRRKSDIVIEHQVVKDFLRQIANVTEKQFSFTNPTLDVNVGKYRLNAVHQSIGRINDDGVVTFAIRIASSHPKIDKSSDFFTPIIVELIELILSTRSSIVIGGITGSGKTEFQKYLLREMKSNERVIVIDNVTELDAVRGNNEIDLTCWQVDENNPNSLPPILIKNALRNNPDWLILAEARDKEMLDVLNSAMTGIPIITTIHAFDVKSLPYRMARLVLRNEQKLEYRDVLNDIFYHFHFYFYLKKEERKDEIKRYISEIGYIDNKGRFFYLYKKENDKHVYFPFVESLVKILNPSSCSKEFKEAFLKEDTNE